MLMVSLLGFIKICSSNHMNIEYLPEIEGSHHPEPSLSGITRNKKVFIGVSPEIDCYISANGAPLLISTHEDTF